MHARFPSPSPRAGFTDLCGGGTAAPTVKCHVVCARVRRLHCAASFVRRRRQLGRERHPCPRTDAFCRSRKSRGLAHPPIAFSARDASLLSERRQRRTKVAVPPGHGRAVMGEGSVLCTSGRRRAKMDGCGASGFSLKSCHSVICILQNVVVWRGFFTFYTEKIVLSQSSCIFVHGMSSDGNKCALCRTRALRGPMKITTSRIPLLGAVPLARQRAHGSTPYRRINSLHRKQ